MNIDQLEPGDVVLIIYKQWASGGYGRKAAQTCPALFLKKTPKAYKFLILYNYYKLPNEKFTHFTIEYIPFKELKICGRSDEKIEISELLTADSKVIRRMGLGLLKETKDKVECSEKSI